MSSTVRAVDVYDAYQEELSESDLWQELDNLAYLLGNVATAESDVDEELEQRLAEAQERVVRARTLVENEVAADVVDDVQGGDPR